MTNIGHFRAAGKLLDKAGSVDARFWICPPTRMDAHTLMEEGYYNIYGRVGARTEMPGCSLCMGNHARVLAGATVLSTSTRNFPNRLGDGAPAVCGSARSRPIWHWYMAPFLLITFDFVVTEPSDYSKN